MGATAPGPQDTPNKQKEFNLEKLYLHSVLGVFSLANSHVFLNRRCQQLTFLITIKCHDTPSLPSRLMSLNNLEVMFILDYMACFTPANIKLPSIEHLLNVSVFNVSDP